MTVSHLKTAYKGINFPRSCSYNHYISLPLKIWAQKMSFLKSPCLCRLFSCLSGLLELNPAFGLCGIDGYNGCRRSISGSRIDIQAVGIQGIL